MTDLLGIRHDIAGYRALLRTEFSDAGRRLISDLLLRARAEEAATETANAEEHCPAGRPSD